MAFDSAFPKSRVGLRTGDGQASKTTGVERADTQVLKATESDGACLRVICGDHGQLGADGDAPEVLRLAADVDRSHGNQTADDDLSTPEGSHQTGLQQVALRLDVQDVTINAC